jgi:hypothetical protein
MKIYLSGPMRGVPYFNFPRFMSETVKLRADGHEVFCPAESDLVQYGPRVCASPTGNLADLKDINFSLREALFRDCQYICNTADTIVLLPGWQKSKGATAEHALAVALGHKVIELPEA